MIYITKNSTNYLITTLTELVTLTGTTYFLVHLEHQNSNIQYNVICQDVSSATTRYNKLKLVESTSPNYTASTLTLGEGEYIYKIYEQSSNTNLNPDLSTSMVEKGLLFVTNGLNAINYIDDNSGITFIILND